MRWGGDLNPQLSRLQVRADATLFEALQVLEKGAQTIAFVCDGDNKVLGTLTDGDARRAILGGAPLDSRCLLSAMSRDFASARPDSGRAEVLDIMRARGIGQLPILDDAGRLCGLHTVGQMITGVERPNWALVLAGGFGTRLSPITDSTPKPMVTVAGRPILERLILHLMSHGIRNFFLAVNHLAHVVEAHFGDGSRFGCHISYVRESVPLGTGGALSLIGEVPPDPLIVVNGDLLTQCDVGRLLEFHDGGGYGATIGVRPYSVDVPYGVVESDGDKLISLAEKPSLRMMINAGVYVLSPQVAKLAEPGHAQPITDFFAACLERGIPVGVHTLEHEWLDIGRPEDLRRARGER